MQVPRVEAEHRVYSFKLQFRFQVSDLKRNLYVISSASDQIRSSAKLKRIMQTILSLGNALNQGNARGPAVDFRLDRLLKLNETHARNNNMILMNYLCKVINEKLLEVLDFSKDLTSIKVQVQVKFLAEEMQSISKGLEKVEQEYSSSENDGSASVVFRKHNLTLACSSIINLSTRITLIPEQMQQLKVLDFRSLPLGMHHCRNRYWQFVASASCNNLASGRIFVELHNGGWRFIGSEKAHDDQNNCARRKGYDLFFLCGGFIHILLKVVSCHQLICTVHTQYSYQRQ